MKGNITAEEARKYLEQPHSLLLDVRNPEEYKSGHIAGSILIPLNVLEKEAPKRIPDTQTTVVVYCQSGARSARAAETLGKLGYANVHDLGGIHRWPYGTVAGD